MTTVAAVALGLIAVLDWVAVARRWTRMEQVAKPLTMVALGWLAITMGALNGSADSAAGTAGSAAAAGASAAADATDSIGFAGDQMGRLLLLALAFSLIGDLFLLGKSPGRFIGGLVSFFLAHVMYVLAFLTQGLQLWWALSGLLVALPLGLISGRRILRAATREAGPALGGAVSAYMLVILAMVVTAGGTGIALVLAGALVFVVSDTVLAMDRFVGPRINARLVVMVTYHLGQVLMVVGALR